jgi:hypothetical protein
MISLINFLKKLTRVLAPRSTRISQEELSKLGETLGLWVYGENRRKDLSNLLIRYLFGTEQ